MANSEYTSLRKSSTNRDLLSDARLQSFMRDDGLAYQQRLLSGARSSSSSSSRSSAQPSYYSSSYGYGGAQPQPRPRQ